MSNRTDIILVTHGGRLKFLKESIPAYLATAGDCRLIVVANRPSLPALDWLIGQMPSICLDVHEENLGFPAAANKAWKRAILEGADYVATTADDLVPLRPDWLNLLIDLVNHCPEVGVAGHSVEPANWVAVGSNGRRYQRQPSNVGGVALIPKRTWRLCGIYNEELPQYGEEDALYGWKVRHAGMCNAYWDHRQDEHGRRFKHIGDDGAKYREWKDDQRKLAIPVREALIKEYEAGRPLNK